MNRLFRPICIAIGLLTVWQLIVWLTGVEPFILPGPVQTIIAGAANFSILLHHGGITLLEIILGLVLGTILGALSAVLVDYFIGARRWLMPVLVLSQAIPVFAIAPILVIWLGYGLPSKVAMACLIIFFPITASLLDGLRRTEPGFLDLANTMLEGKANWRRVLLLRVKIPAALPAFASGLRVATAVAPIGAIVGEWVGSSAGLGYLMLHATARMQVDLMFAALAILALISLTLYYGVDWALRQALPWQKEILIQA